MSSPLARINFPVPTSDEFDYVPIEGRDIRVGDDVLALFGGQGGVFIVTPPSGGWWFYLVVGEDAGTGEYTLGGAQFPEDPESLPESWLARFAMWRLAEKPSDGYTLAAPGGSQWAYPAGEDGRMICYTAGTGHSRGDRAYRGELLTDPRDLWINADAEFDWLPVTDGATVVPGDVVRYLATGSGVVDTIGESTTPEGLAAYDMYDADGNYLGRWLDIPTSPKTTFSRHFQRVPKPAVGDKFVAADGSRWIYTGTDPYYCWGRGSRYSPGAIFQRGEIAGGLRPIT